MALRKVTVKSLILCQKCGNVMVTKVIKRKKNFETDEREKIYQCIVCKYWIPYNHK